MAESARRRSEAVAATQIGSVGPLTFDEIRHQFELRNSAADHIEKRHCSSCPNVRESLPPLVATVSFTLAGHPPVAGICAANNSPKCKDFHTSSLAEFYSVLRLHVRH
jgi:hypothetical protein